MHGLNQVNMRERLSLSLFHSPNNNLKIFKFLINESHTRLIVFKKIPHRKNQEKWERDVVVPCNWRCAQTSEDFYPFRMELWWLRVLAMCWTGKQITNVNLVKIVELMHHLANEELAVSLDIVGYGKLHHRKHVLRKVKEKCLVGHFCIYPKKCHFF